MEYQSIILAMVGSVIALIAVVIALFLWNRTEARADYRKLDEENKQLRRELIDVMRVAKEDWKEFRERWAEESKDFHGRLCAIEERRGK